MINLIRRFRLSAYFIIVMLLALMLIIPHMVFPALGRYAVSFPQLSPFLAVLILALVLKDRTSLADIGHRLAFPANIVRWLFPAVAIPAVCIGISSLVLTAFRVEFVPWTGNAAFYLLNGLGMLIGCAGEELGWRGFLLPNLQKRFSPMVSSLIVGALWGVWHLNFTGGLLGFVLYNITIVEMAILMTWLYNRTQGNLILMIVWHFIFNLTSHLLLWDRFGNRLFLVEGVVFAGVGLVWLWGRGTDMMTARTAPIVEDFPIPFRKA